MKEEILLGVLAVIQIVSIPLGFRFGFRFRNWLERKWREDADAWIKLSKRHYVYVRTADDAVIAHIWKGKKKGVWWCEQDDQYEFPYQFSTRAGVQRWVEMYFAKFIHPEMVDAEGVKGLVA